MKKDFDLTKFFLPYQAAWINDKAQFKLWEKSRQIGASYATAYEDVEDCLTNPHIPACWIGSKNLSTAKEYIEYCQYWANIYAGVFVKIEQEIKDGESQISVQFKNGKKITAMASTPDGMRGKRGKINLDEFDFHADQDKLYKVAFAMTTWGYPLRIFSTISEEDNTRFKKLIDEIKAGALPDYSHHFTDLYMAVDQGLADKIAQMKLSKEERMNFKGITEQERAQFIEKIRRNCLTQENFDQEYRCIRIDSSKKFLSYKLIEECSVRNLCDIVTIQDLDDVRKIDKDLLQECIALLADNNYLGVDIARSGHLSALWFLEKEAIKTTNLLMIIKNTHLHVQEEIVAEFLNSKKIKKVCIDATQIGLQLSESLEKRYGKYRVEPVVFTNALKADLAYRVYLDFEDGSILVPRDDDVIADLRSIKKKTTATGKPLFDSDGNTDGHADRFWALALADYAADDEQQPIIDCIGSANPRKILKAINGF